MPAAVQNERQPRNSAQVRQEQIEAELHHAIGPNAATVSATHPAFTPSGSHRFMVGLVSAESHSKVDHHTDTGTADSYSATLNSFVHLWLV